MLLPKMKTNYFGSFRSFHWFLLLLAYSKVAAYLGETISNSDEKEVKQGVSYSGAQLLKVARCPELMAIVNENDLNIWFVNGTHVDLMVPANKLQDVKQQLLKRMIEYYVMIDDLEYLIRQQSRSSKYRQMATDKKNNSLTWDKYHTIDEIFEYMDYLREHYPTVVEVGTLGYSFYKRPLKYLRILSNNTNAKAVYIDGGVHAREWVSPSSVTYIIKELVENRSQLPNDLLNLEYYIIPIVNPDGYEYSFKEDRLWRKNRSGRGTCVGTDINRNYDYKWSQSGSSKNPCSETYRGPAPASENETKAVKKLLLSLKGKIGAYISFHSYGQYILIPFGFDYYSLPPDFNELKAVGDLAAWNIYKINGVKYEVGNSAQLLYAVAGSSDDWAKAVVGVKYTYTVELRDEGKYAFLLPPDLIQPTAIDAFEAFKTIATAAHNI